MLGDVYPIAGSAPSGQQKDFPVVVAPTAPTFPQKGTAWFNSGTNTMSIWDGTRWQLLSAGSALPVATKAGQFIYSGSGPTFNWIASADVDLDAGRYF